MAQNKKLVKLNFSFLENADFVIHKFQFKLVGIKKSEEIN
jgi:hypothetical protein